VPVAPTGPMSPPLTAALPAAGTVSSSPAPVAHGGLGTTIGFFLPPSEQAAAAAKASSLAWERPGALAVAPKEAVSNAWGVRGPPAVAAAELGALRTLVAATHGLWAQRTLARLLSGALLLSDGSDLSNVASGPSAPNGGSAPLPAAPGAPSPAGSSSTSWLGAGAGGGFLGLGVLALLLALSPLGIRLLRHPQNFLRPNSALVLVLERPG
jgi:hypothetical protein